MPTVYHNNICYLAQKAARLYLQTLDVDNKLSFLDAAHIYQGLSAVELRNARVVCQCVLAQAETQHEGNWEALLRVYLYENADDVEEDTFHAHAGEVFSKFMGDPDTLCANMNAAIQTDEQGDEFTCMFVLPMQQGWGVKERTWFSFLELRINCAGSTIGGY